MTQRDAWAPLFPDQPALDKEDIARRLGSVEVKQAKDPRLHFGMLAPRGFRRSDPREVESPSGVLLSLCAGSPPRADISVTADELRREVSPSEWVKNKLERAGHTLLAQRERYEGVGAVADLLTETKTASGRFIARTNMVKDAGRIFTITCRAHEDDYPGLAAEFFAVMASFQLLHAEGKPLSEPLGAFCYIHPVVFGFSYPASWRLVTEASRDEDECDLRLDDFDGDHCAGRLYVRSRPKQRTHQMMSEILATMEQAGVRPAAPPELVRCDAPQGFARASSVVSAAAHGTGDAEIRALALEVPEMTLLFALAGPARSLSADWWAINKRAFEIVRSSVYVV